MASVSGVSVVTNYDRIPSVAELLDEICQLSKGLPQGCCSCSLQQFCEEAGDKTWEEWLQEECD